MSPKDTPRLQARREATLQEIIRTAWTQVTERGPAALSLRGIARSMGLTAPALYRYFPGRDELVTAMILASFETLGDALAASIDRMSGEDHARRYLAVGLAYRGWALANPERFALMFGAPIPADHASPTGMLPAAARAMGVLMAVLQAAWQAGRLQRPPILGPSLSGQMRAWKEAHAADAHPTVLYLTLVCWARLHGLTTLELHGHFPPEVTSPDEIFLNELHALRAEIGLSV